MSLDDWEEAARLILEEGASARVTALDAEVRRLREALEKHGCHMGDCQGDMHNPYGCTCGLQEALGEDS